MVRFLTILLPLLRYFKFRVNYATSKMHHAPFILLYTCVLSQKRPFVIVWSYLRGQRQVQIERRRGERRRAILAFAIGQQSLDGAAPTSHGTSLRSPRQICGNPTPIACTGVRQLGRHRRPPHRTLAHDTSLGRRAPVERRRFHVRLGRHLLRGYRCGCNQAVACHPGIQCRSHRSACPPPCSRHCRTR